MSKNLVIVESPAKAKTIQQFLGPDYKVEASFGHVRDLPKSGMGIDIEHGFMPTYEISPDKKKRVSELKKLAKGAEVWLASDEDREGEAIAWHLCAALGLDSKKTKRIVFHEITKDAILRAAAKPRHVDQNLVDAQQARRVLDRLVGYELSPVLWKKIQPGLSAGRVQSVAVRLIVEREREIDNFTAGSNYKVTAQFKTEAGAAFSAELPQRWATPEEARSFLEACAGAGFSIAGIETKPAKRTPAPPFTTSTLQQEAARKLGFSVKQTMVVAQHLYEAGKITYMRTDSVHLSDLALGAAAEAITRQFGAQYHQRRQFTTKSAGAQEAHEAIRPTHFEHDSTTGERNEQRLYSLIWKRAVASQMAEAQLERTTAQIAISTRPELLQAKGETVVFDGFLKLYLAHESDDEAEQEGILPPLAAGQPVSLQQMTAVQTYDRAKPRYTEASLVKKLEEMGIGRPSTYAPTISTVQDRGYVVKGDLEGSERPVKTLTLTAAASAVTETNSTETTGADHNKLIPTSTGMVVSDFLVAHFPTVVDYKFTSKVEDEFDKIADGKEAWNRMIADFYGPFHQTVEAAESLSREQVSHARHLGIDPKTGKPVIARIGRFGPMLQIGEAKDADGKEMEEKPRFAPMPDGRRLDDVTLEEALTMFQLPRTLGATPAGVHQEAGKPV
jgi:DNA topoisomerase-1